MPTCDMHQRSLVKCIDVNTEDFRDVFAPRRVQEINVKIFRTAEIRHIRVHFSVITPSLIKVTARAQILYRSMAVSLNERLTRWF
jgi:hypothetical protein